MYITPNQLHKKIGQFLAHPVGLCILKQPLQKCVLGTRVGALFMVPGQDCTMEVTCIARLSVDLANK